MAGVLCLATVDELKARSSVKPRPSSPPQPVPRLHSLDADGLSPTLSFAASELFFDAASELGPPSVSSSLEDGYHLLLDDARRLSNTTNGGGESPSASLPEAALLRQAVTSSGSARKLMQPWGAGWQAKYMDEVARRTAAEATLQELRSQLDDVWAVVSGSAAVPVSSPSAPPAPAVEAALQAAAAAAARASRQQREQELQQAAKAAQAAVALSAAAASAEAEDRLVVARLVARVLGRAAAAADLECECEHKLGVLQRRLDQHMRMSEGMLRKQVAATSAAEPWRHQLLNGLLSVSCLALGATVTLLVVNRTHAGPQ
eukprot:scaffold18.g1954.t1